MINIKTLTNKVKKAGLEIELINLNGKNTFAWFISLEKEVNGRMRVVDCATERPITQYLKRSNVGYKYSDNCLGIWVYQ